MPAALTQRAGATFVALALAYAPSPALGKNCDFGGLLFLGTNSNSSRSVWLSGTIAGSYRLDAAQGSQTVDAWTMTRRGLPFSLSPVVSAAMVEHTSSTIRAAARTVLSRHRIKRAVLNSRRTYRCLIQSLPGGVSPLIVNFFPYFGRPSLPGAVTPPFGALPPSGLTPGVPGAVKPPIATLPPSGLTPSVPGGVAPPIATLPPGAPPSGLTPGMPGGVAPPIATLPPSGLTPICPGRRRTADCDLATRTAAERFDARDARWRCSTNRNAATERTDTKCPERRRAADCDLATRTAAESFHARDARWCCSTNRNAATERTDISCPDGSAMSIATLHPDCRRAV